MNNSKGFILLENMLALTFVVILSMCALKLMLSAGEVYARGQSIIMGVQLATQEANGVAVVSDRYSIRSQREEQQLAAGISISKNVIGVYDQYKAVYVLSLVVYQ